MKTFSTLTLVLGLMSAGAAQGALVVNTTAAGTFATAPATAPTVSGTDLAQAPGAAITGSINNGTLSNLIDGSVGASGNGNSDASTAGQIRNGDSFTITLDTTVNTAGYDISEIFSVAGWNPGSGGRSNQGYGVTFNLVGGGTTVITSQTFIANTPGTQYWTTVSLTDGDTGLLATGVESIVFDNFDDANPGGNVIYREFDVIGTAAIPEPSSLALLGLGGLMMAKRRRRG